MEQLVMATNNAHKVLEIQAMLSQYRILSLKDIGCTEEIDETSDTLEGNSLIKAMYVKQKYGFNCFADDTGLEVEALGGRPGVYSARYAGKNGDFEANIIKLLGELNNTTNRKAQFRTVITLIDNDIPIVFEGIIKGNIIHEKRGIGGFGYDSVFIPVGHTLSFAEMPSETKNLISHRAIAIKKLAEYIAKKHQ